MKTLSNISALAANALFALAVILPAPLLAADADFEDSLNIAKVTGDDETISNKTKVEKKSTITSFSSRNNKIVKIHPDIVKRTMHMSVKNIVGSKVSIHVFDASGILVKVYDLKPKGHIITEGLAPGKYTYIVLVDDEESVKGLFDIR
ncbi:MAG TPA: hypothetical protein PKA77_12015 [Chitinophagaceae bacterium]|jgi:hypothetical protein|nr:hypothetical protein [Chitinophagaceae bacterium]HMU58747.1 hypothetical protein [Chitinophagaceae bacterium]